MKIVDHRYVIASWLSCLQQRAGLKKNSGVLSRAYGALAMHQSKKTAAKSHLANIPICERRALRYVLRLKSLTVGLSLRTWNDRA